MMRMRFSLQMAIRVREILVPLDWVRDAMVWQGIASVDCV